MQVTDKTLTVDRWKHVGRNPPKQSDTSYWSVILSRAMLRVSSKPSIKLCTVSAYMFAEAKAEFEMMVSKGWGSTGCTLMAEMWAELGDTEKLQEVIKMVEEKGPVSPAKKLYMKIRLIKAQLKRCREFYIKYYYK